MGMIGIHNRLAFMKLYRDLSGQGTLVAPGGNRILEIEDYEMILDMNDSPCSSFEARKFSLDYAKAEMWWYLGGDKFDRSIEKRASIWPKIVQPDGSFLSNYGQYIFGENQIKWVIDELGRDKDSRRASIVLLRREHLFQSNKDVVCTYGLNFRIRNDRLNMSVSMRSNDAILGTSNDVFAFTCLYRMVLAAMKFNKYPDVVPGRYTHKVDSMHVYEKHWDMLKKLVLANGEDYTLIDVPFVSSVHDLAFLLSINTLGYREPPPEFALASFLFNRDKP